MIYVCVFFIVINVPGSRPFSIPISSCANIPSGVSNCENSRLVGADVREALKLIGEHISKKTDAAGSYRKPPAVFSRLARGGKTTMLRLVFDASKNPSMDFNCILITFNGDSGFKIRQNETQSAAILRLICAQLVLCTLEEASLLVCDEKALDDYIGTKPFILLVDELNALSYPPDQDAAILLRRMFLDKENRYLIFSSHVPISLDDCINAASHLLGVVNSAASYASNRGMLLLSMSISNDLKLLRGMHPACNGLTPTEVAMYGGIPGLIYSMKAIPGITIAQRFTSANIRLEQESKKTLLMELLSELKNGLRTGKVIRRFDRFSSIDTDGNVEWPLCYTFHILQMLDAFDGVFYLTQQLQGIFHAAQEVGSGKDWEKIIYVAIMLQCLRARHLNEDLPFGLKVKNLQLVKFLSFGVDIVTVEAASSFLKKELQKCSSYPAVIFVVPTISAFPLFDGFLAIQRSNSFFKGIEINGIQAKKGKDYPNSSVPRCLKHGYLLQGDAPQTTRGSLSLNGWVYVNRDSILHLLGHTLSKLYPSNLA